MNILRLLHSADWQLGARLSQFGQRGTLLRQARIETLQRTLALGREHQVGAFLIAGDLFEENQIDNILVAEVVELFRAHPDIPVYILLGNLDPHTGPDSIWQNRLLLDAPPNVHILRETGVTEPAAKTAAQLAFAQAEARVVATKTELPHDLGKYRPRLPETHPRHTYRSNPKPPNPNPNLHPERYRGVGQPVLRMS